MTSNTFTAISVLLSNLNDYEISLLSSLVERMKLDRKQATEGTVEIVKKNDVSLPVRVWNNPQRRKNRYVKKKRNGNERKKVEWKNCTLEEMMQFNDKDEEDLMGDSLPDPRVTKEELDRELDEIAQTIYNYNFFSNILESLQNIV